MKRSLVIHSLSVVLEAARAEQIRLVIAYHDMTQLVCLWREPHAWIGSNDIAIQKAWTAIAFSGRTPSEGVSTAQLHDLSGPGGELYGVRGTNDGRVIVFPGGVPVYSNGRLVGGIGVAGSTVENDERFAHIALAAYLGQKQGVEVAEDETEITPVLSPPATESTPVGRVLPPLADEDDWDN